MSDKPWLTDPKYGGMSELAARRSYEAWVAQGRRVLPHKRPPASDEVIAKHKRIVETMLDEYEAELNAYARFLTKWRGKRPRKFRAHRRGVAAE
jgi:hypothetical protein